MKGWWTRLLPLARGERRRLAALAGLSVAGIALEALLPWPIKLMVDYVLAGKALPELAAWIGTLPGAAPGAPLLAWLGFGVVLLFLGIALLQLAKGVLGAEISARLRFALGAALFERLQQLSLTWHRRAHRGDLLRRVTSDAGCLSTLVMEILFPVATSLLTLIVLFAVMWQLDARLALIAALVAVPMAILMRVLGPRMSERAYLHEQAEGAVWAGAEQTLMAIPVVQGFGRELEEEARFSGLTERSVATYLRTLSSQLQFRIGIDASEVLGIAAIMLAGGWQVLAGSMTVGTLLVFLSYVTALYAPLLAFAYLAMTVASAAAGARRVEEVLEATDAVAERPGARTLLRGGKDAGAVRFERVVFGHVPGTPVLRDIDLDVRPGETIALVGPSGAGKSTLVALIPRLADPWAGRVLLGGHDLRDLTLASARDQVGLVLQDPFVLPLSIADNIAYGWPRATRAQIRAAAAAAKADAFIDALPQGYDTMLGERGVTLSGGQRQRLSIARALLKDTPILIMDEPTSALDLETEKGILDALEASSAGRTTFIVAHRLSTVRRADRIVVLDRGLIEAIGTHAELLAASSLYRLLYVSELIRNTTPAAASALQRSA